MLTIRDFDFVLELILLLTHTYTCPLHAQRNYIKIVQQKLWEIPTFICGNCMSNFEINLLKIFIYHMHVFFIMKFAITQSKIVLET